MIRLTSHGNWDKTRKFLNRVMGGDIYSPLDKYGRLGVDRLSAATPVDTGLTSNSWGYQVTKGASPRIEWYNNNTIRTGVPVVLLLQYGHGTGTGGYVHGQDFINPATAAVFDAAADDVWKEVIK